MKGLVLLAVFSSISFIIAYFLGRKRQIGFGWSFFFCLSLTPIGGFITTMLSRKYFNPNPEPSNSKQIWGWVIIIMFSLSILVQIIEIINNSYYVNTLSEFFTFFMLSGFVGLGFYLVQLGKGKNFNKKALTKSNE